jgi:hypothetical protein
MLYRIIKIGRIVVLCWIVFMFVDLIIMIGSYLKIRALEIDGLHHVTRVIFFAGNVTRVIWYHIIILLCGLGSK